MLDLGTLRHRLVLQRPLEVQNNTSGAVNKTWVDVATVWAAIEPLSAREFIAAQSETSRVTTRITIRYRDDVNDKYRFYHAAKDKYYDIHGTLADKHSGLDYLTCPCSEGVKYQDGQPEQVLPVVLIAPVITGNPANGNLISVNDGLWANGPTSYTYQWYLNDLPVASATASSWIVDGEQDDIITVGVRGVNAAGSGLESFTQGVLIT